MKRSIPGFLRHGLLLSLSLWTVASVCYLAPTALEGPIDAHYLLFLARCAATGIAITLALSILFQRTLEWSRGRRLACWIGGTTVAVVIHAASDTWLYLAMYRPELAAAASGQPGPRLAMLLLNIVLLGAVYVIYATGLALNLLSEALRVRERRLAAALAAAQDAQLAALRLQINPHFLFNALNAATSLIGSGRNVEAEMVIERLADFFRASLDGPVGALVPVEEEFDLVAAYLRIETARFGDRLTLDVDLPDELSQVLAPHFLLQPLVENAVKHGVARTRAPVTVTVSATADDGVLTLAVRDDAPADEVEGEPAPSAGVGLANVRARLAALFGDAAELRTRGLQPGFLAEVRIPLDRAAALQAAR